ncbi:hypothetical protein RJ639_010281 [Escallonia herrerae]|uniref:Chlororespiratory reduction 4 n=1 Tax=Escallonia herrerae TaxID=1293975 RepID=A0AA88VQK6_9ASTE|nr:hypothetical protein RJ639_010281 [Escallonia herrerae]
MTEQYLWSPKERKCLRLLQQKNTRASLLQIHAFMLRSALETNVNLLTKFITACSSAAALFVASDSVVGIHHARQVFDNRPHRNDTFLCNTMMKSHLGMRQFNESITLYRDLLRDTCFTPDNYTFVTLAKSCSSSLALWEDAAAYNVVIDGYVKVGDMSSARNLFEQMPQRDVVSWTSMVDGYCRNGDVGSARLLFDEMPEKNLYSWNAMVGGYCQNKQPHEALKLFHELQSETSLEPDEVTVVSVLPAIADLGALDLGGWIHQYVRSKKLDKKLNVCTALIDMYAKCGEIKKAKRVFDSMPKKETSVWNSLINGLAINGCGKEALDAFMEMEMKRFMPNEITMLAVLSACNHSGMVEEGRRWFKAMEVFSLTPRIEHYGCMVDLLGRAGCLEEAEKLIDRMPYAVNGIILSSFLFACSYASDVTRAKRVLEKTTEMEPWNDGNYVMLRNLYATERRWKDVEDIKGLMRQKGAKKEVGCSSIEVNGRVCEFVAADISHPQRGLIRSVLGHLLIHIKRQNTCTDENVNGW